MADLTNMKLELVVSSGIPEALVATLNYAAKVRETMDPAILKRFDALNLSISEAFWRIFGIEAKV